MHIQFYKKFSTLFFSFSFLFFSFLAAQDSTVIPLWQNGAPGFEK